MRDNSQIQKELEANTQKLLDYLERVNPEILDKRPAPDSWSILEVFEHIIIIDQAIMMMFNGPAEKVERNPEEKIEAIEATFYNYERQYPAPEPIAPKGMIKDAAAVKAQLPKVRTAFLEAGKSSDWSAECKAFKHFHFGYLTRIEWAYFSIIHANRHLVQMQKAEAALSV